MNMQLLIDSDEFWRNFQKDIQASRDHIYIQTLSFEGDRIGEMVSAELLSAQSKDIRILVDSYNKYVLNDRFLYTIKNCFDSELQAENERTLIMLKWLNQTGIQVKYTNPVGPFLIRFPARNHKKMILIDDHISYIGGINFSDHNFEWHDSMVRIDDPDINAFLKNDFFLTWEGRHIYSEKAFNGIHFYLYDGYSNEKTFGTIFDIIDNAQESIFIESAYLSFPFYEKLRAAVKRGIAVTVIAPRKNNRKHVGRYTLWEAKRSGVNLMLYQPGMTHVKAMLVDDRILIFGSTNFDYVSYRIEQELVTIITDSEIINNFKDQVIEADLKNSLRFDGKVNHKRGFIHYIGLILVGKIYTSLARL